MKNRIMMPAVEWLLHWMGKNEYFIGNDLPQAIDQAKEMEIEQHGRTWDSAIQSHYDRGHVHARSLVDFDEYEIK